MKKTLTTLLVIISIVPVQGQGMTSVADSIRRIYKIPALAFAVISSDSIFELHTIGVRKINTALYVNADDRFHLGSNTKAITSFIAALLVDRKKINWDTKFLDLFPGLRYRCKKTYRSITLENLLTFRAKLPAYTYTFNKPRRNEITGSNAEQRLLLAKYFLSQPEMKAQNGLTPSNADYVLAGLMLEKAAGKSYKELVADLGKSQKINFGFDYPNLSDTLQPWGHDANLKPQPPSYNYKLNWLLSAGNINVSLPGYVKFIQLQLKGLKGKSAILSKQVFHKLLFGRPAFAFGWFNKTDPGTNHAVAFNEGNAGAFISRVQIIAEADRAYIILANSATDDTIEGIEILQARLQAKYGR